MQKARPALPLASAIPAENVPSLETGILSLLSFLGHSFKRGTISNELYEREKTAALRNLDTIRSMDAGEGSDDFDERALADDRKKQKLAKNKHDIESLLAFLEDSYNEGAISDKSYRELKSENVKKLSRINKLISGPIGDETSLEAPSEIYEKLSSGGAIDGDEGAEGEEGEDEGGEYGAAARESAGSKPESEPVPVSQRKNFAIASQPELDEPVVKPVSFREKLRSFSSMPPIGARARLSEADEILSALNVNPQKTRKEQEMIDHVSGAEDELGNPDDAGIDDGSTRRGREYSELENEPIRRGQGAIDEDDVADRQSNSGRVISEQEYGADDIMQSLNIGKKKPGGGANEPGQYLDLGGEPHAMQEAAQSKTSALLGKLGGIVGKLKKSPQKSAGADGEATASQASSGGDSAAPSGQPSWADKLPEEMTPQELAEYNKSRTQAESEAQGGGPLETEDAPATSGGRRSAGNNSDEGGPAASSAEQERLVLEIEKMKVKLETVENTRTVIEERIEHIMESIGELRTMLFEKESSGKEQEAKLDKFVEMVSDLEPQRFAKELDKRDRQLGEQAMKLEKLETISGDMSQTVSKLRAMLEAIGSLKNIATVSKDIADRSAKIDNTVSKVERLADETGRVYIELSRKLNEFTLYRGKQDIMAESLKELVGMTESMSGKIDNYVTRDDFSEIKRGLEDAKISVSELQTKLELAAEGDDLPDHIKDLQEEKEGLEQILESNEEEFIEGRIKEPEYKKMKETHVRKLQAVRQKLREEFSKMRKEKASQARRSTEIVDQARESAGQEGASEAEPESEPDLHPAPSKGERDSGLEEKSQRPPIKPAQSVQRVSQKAPLATPAQTSGVPKRTSTSKTLSAKPRALSAPAQQQPQAPLQDEEAGDEQADDSQGREIDGEVDEEALQQAEETAQLEDETQEMLEGEESPDESGQGESEEPVSPMRRPPKMPMKVKGTLPSGRLPPRTAPMPRNPLAQGRPSTPRQSQSPSSMPGTLQSPSSRPMQGPVRAGDFQKPLPQKAISSAPALSLKTEKPLPTKGGVRIYDIIKGASVGKRVLIDVQATTIKKGSQQCLVKLEDDSGVIYGTSATPLKGRLAIQGNVAKDPQGVPYIKIISAA